MDTLFRDIVYALRQLGPAGGFTAIAILTLALGIGRTTAIFTLIHAVMLSRWQIPLGHVLVPLVRAPRGRRAGVRGAGGVGPGDGVPDGGGLDGVGGAGDPRGRSGTHAGATHRLGDATFLLPVPQPPDLPASAGIATMLVTLKMPKPNWSRTANSALHRAKAGGRNQIVS